MTTECICGHTKEDPNPDCERCRLIARIDGLETRDARRQEIINRQAERIDALEEDMQDRREGDKRILDDGGYPDEAHCSCVPTLRKRIAELEARVKELEYCDCGRPLSKGQCGICDNDD